LRPHFSYYPFSKDNKPIFERFLFKQLNILYKIFNQLSKMSANLKRIQSLQQEINEYFEKHGYTFITPLSDSKVLNKVFLIKIIKIIKNI
jgi:hypothetical protein